MTADGVRAPQFRVRMTAREVRAPHPSGTQFIGSARMTAPGVCAPQFQVCMTACEVRAPQFQVRMAPLFEVRAPQFQVRMAPLFEVRAPQCQAHNSLGTHA